MNWVSSGSWSLGDLEKRRFEAVLDCLLGDSVLSLGCRDGTFELRAAQENPNRRVVGIDTDASAITWANEQAVKTGIENVVFHTMDLFDAPNLGTFATVVVMEVLEHLPPNRIDEAFNLALGMANKRLIITTPANTHISDEDHKSVFVREQFHGKPNLTWIPTMPWLWLGFYIQK